MTEIAVAAWRPSLRVLVMRALVAAVLSFIPFVAIAWYLDQWSILALFACLTVIYLIAMEDPLAWLRTRSERWRLTTTHLHFEGNDGAAMIPLGEVTRISIRFRNTIVISLTNGQGVTMRGMADAKTVKTILDRTRGAA